MISSEEKPEILLQTTFIAVLTLLVTSAVFGEQAIVQNRPLADVIAEFVNNTSASVSQTIPNKQDFIDQFTLFKQQKDSELVPLLDQMGLLISIYAQNQSGLQASSEQVIADFEQLAQDLQQLESQYPRFQEVEQIIKPQIDDLVITLKDGFPTLSQPGPNESPLAHFTRFFQDTETRNSFGLGEFFRLEPLENETRLKIVKELIHEMTVNGVAQNKILFQEIFKYKNDVLVYHRVIQDDQIIEETLTLDDISIFHGLPARMRQDGVDDRLVRYVEENIKLLNFHLVEAFHQQGLEIDINHPQLGVPAGYSPAAFVTNLMQIFLDLSAATLVSPT